MYTWSYVTFNVRRDLPDSSLVFDADRARPCVETHFPGQSERVWAQSGTFEGGLAFGPG